MNAIILAAGLSSRMNPLTKDLHKGLLPIANTTIIEKQIQFLKEAGISEINIVTGHGEKFFEPLKKKFGINLIYNRHYETRNNLYSLYLARKHLRDSYVIEGDTFIFNNIFNAKPIESTYFVSYRRDFEREWVVVEEKQKVIAIDIRKGNGNVIAGISYWTGKEADILVESMKQTIEVQRKYEEPWGNAVLDSLPDLDLSVRHLKEDDIFEIDTLKDYFELKKRLENMSCPNGGMKEGENSQWSI